MPTIAMYPGSFDPVTNGHLDIIKRSSRMFDKVIVAVLVNSAKTPLFTVEERVAMLRESCKNIPNVEIDSFNGLTVTFAKQKGATVMVRGLRAVTDFENEIQLAHTNFAMMPEIETVFLATAIKWSYLSSTIVREAAHYGQDVSRFVPRNVERALIAKREAGELYSASRCTTPAPMPLRTMTRRPKCSGWPRLLPTASTLQAARRSRIR